MLKEPLHSIVSNEDKDTAQAVTAGSEIPSHLHQGQAVIIPLWLPILTE